MIEWWQAEGLCTGATGVDDPGGKDRLSNSSSRGQYPSKIELFYPIPSVQRVVHVIEGQCVTAIEPSPSSLSQPACCQCFVFTKIFFEGTGGILAMAMPYSSGEVPPLSMTNGVVIKIKHRRENDPEIAAMQLIRHHLQQRRQDSTPSIIQLLDCMQDDKYSYLVLPYVPDGDLFTCLQSRGGCGFPDRQAATYFTQVAQALLFMKEVCGLAHLDVSLENIMLIQNGAQNGAAQLIDMDLCVQVPEAWKEGDRLVLQHRGKQSYISPELAQKVATCDPFAADIWSLGVCLYTMLTGKSLYTSTASKAFYYLTQEGGIQAVVCAYEKYGLVISRLAKDLIYRMLHADPSQRPTLRMVLSHPFVTSNQHVQ